MLYVLQSVYSSWRLLEFDYQIFQVLENLWNFYEVLLEFSQNSLLYFFFEKFFILFRICNDSSVVGAFWFHLLFSTTLTKVFFL
jgi:hypothetical protein